MAGQVPRVAVPGVAQGAISILEARRERFLWSLAMLKTERVACDDGVPSGVVARRQAANRVAVRSAGSPESVRSEHMSRPLNRSG